MSRSRPTPATRRSVAGARADVDGILRLGRIVEPITHDWDHWPQIWHAGPAAGAARRTDP